MNLFFPQVTALFGKRVFLQPVIQPSHCRPLNISLENLPAATWCKVRHSQPRATTTFSWVVDGEYDQSVPHSGHLRPLISFFFGLPWTLRDCVRAKAGDFSESPKLRFSFLSCFETACFLLFFASLPWAPCSEWRTYWFCSRSTDRNTGSAGPRLHVPCCRFFPTERCSPGLSHQLSTPHKPF